MVRSLLFVLSLAALLVSTIAAGLFLGVKVGLTDPETLKHIEIVIAVTWGIVGSLWATLGIINLSKQYSMDNFTTKSQKRLPYFRKPADFVNRINDLRSIIERLDNSKLVCIHGQRGVGKSELLRYLSDCANKFDALNILPEDIAHLLISKNISEANYVDLTDTLGWKEALQQISYICLGINSENIHDFAKKIEDEKPKNSVLFILDNLNNDSLRANLINNISVYKMRRPQDYFVLGSVKDIFDPRFSLISQEIEPFSEMHCKLFLERYGVASDDIRLQNAYLDSAGLPLFLKFMVVEKRLGVISQENFGFYFVQEILAKMNKDDQEFLKFLCVCNLAVTAIQISELHHIGITAVEPKLLRLKRSSSVIWISDGIVNSVKIHDLIRDIMLDYFSSEISEVAKKAASFLLHINNLAYVTVISIAEIDSDGDIEFVANQISKQLRESNFPFILSYWDVVSKWADEQAMFFRARMLRERITSAYLAALLGTGQYKKARNLSKTTAFRELFSIRDKNLTTDLEFEVKYSLIDLDHLTNNYALAIEMNEFLLTRMVELKWEQKIAKSLWMQAHLLGHIGLDLPLAVKTYQEC